MTNSNIHVLNPQLKLTFQDFTANGKPSINQNLIQALAKLHQTNTSELMIYTAQRKRFTTKIQVHFTRDLLLERHISITAPDAIRIEHEHHCCFEFDITHNGKSKTANEDYLKLHLCRFFKVVEEVSLDVAIATPPATPVEEKGGSLADYKRWALEYKKEEEALLRDAFKTARILVSYDFDPTSSEFDYLENVLKMALIKRGVYNECRHEISRRLFDQFISE